MALCAGLTAQQTDPEACVPPDDPANATVPATPAFDPALTYIPLDLRQKYLYSLNEMAGPTQWIGFAIHASMDQAQKSPTAWGNGMDGFGDRLANHFGRSFLRENIAFGVRALDHEDPRYFRIGTGTTRQRVRYALRNTYMTRRDDGGWMPAYSRFVADYTTPFLAQTWRPEGFSVGRGFRGGTAAIGAGFGTNLFQEFLPDLKKRFWKRHRSAAAFAATPDSDSSVPAP